MKKIFFFVLLLSILILPNFAVLSAFIDAGANDIKRYKDFIALNRKITWVPDNYPEIQEAINNANEGGTVAVSPRTSIINVLIDCVNRVTNSFDTNSYNQKKEITLAYAT